MAVLFEAPIAYVARTDFRQRYYANDHSRDTVVLDPQPMPIIDGRAEDLSLDKEGVILTRHESAIADFADEEEVAENHPAEIEKLLLELTGADAVIVTGKPIRRFSERGGQAGSADNSHPARFVHIDITTDTAEGFAKRAVPDDRKVSRYAHYNVWRAFSGVPQDVGLAVCDAESVAADDRIVADAIFDPPGGAPEWSFESWILAPSDSHRWLGFTDMTRDEVLVFKTSDSRFHNPAPHVAYDNPTAPEDAPPRASVEMRAIALWFD